MIRSFFVRLALSSLTLTAGFLELPANALNFSSILEFFQETSPSIPSREQPVEQAPSAQVKQNPAQPTDSVEPIEQAIHTQVNNYRATLGLPPLSLAVRQL